ncbi:hypothetical protein AB0J28_02695 [Streptosporangium canum]|uniref:hypothetical protein n=1 Tax=Streptosporangium canum TaxID=324952 RepID=UPI0034300A18
MRSRRDDLTMSTPTTTKQEDLRSRMPNPLSFVPAALIAKPIPGMPPARTTASKKSE